MKIALILVLIVIPITFTFPQLGFETNFQSNEISPTVILRSDVIRYYSFQYNIFSVTVVPKDPYNLNKPSGSMYGIYSLGTVIGTFLLTISGGHDGMSLADLLPDSSAFKAILKTIGTSLIVPIVLSNSQHHLHIFGKDSLQQRKTDLTVFAGFQTDYFDQREINWGRFAVKSGLEFTLRVDNFLAVKRTESICFVLQTGVTKHWDFAEHAQINSRLLGFLGAKIYFPM